MARDIQEMLGAIYRAESGRILATLIGLLGNFDHAEEAMHEAFRAALESWSANGTPQNPVAWLISAGRFKAIDRLRRQRWETPLEDALEKAQPVTDSEESEGRHFPDDRLRLILTCCHPDLAPEARVALTLREGWGCGGALVRMPGIPRGGMSTLVYFVSDDCAIEEKRIIEAGGKRSYDFYDQRL